MKFSFDFFVVAGVMTLILLPVRLLFVEFVSDSTWGSLGVISAISIIMIFLVKKGKLGKFGVMFENEMQRLTRGKRRVFILSWLLVLTVYFAFSIYSIDQGNSIYFEEKEEIKAMVLEQYDLDFENPDSVIETLEPSQVIGGLPEYTNALFNNFKAIAIVQAVMNDISNGFLLHFHSVFIIESLEVLGIYIYYNYQFRKKRGVINN